MNKDRLDPIYYATQEVEKFLAQTEPGPKGIFSGFPTASEIIALGESVRRAGEALNADRKSAEREPAVSQYRDALARLKARLEELAPKLMAERDRLRSEWERLRAASAWAASQKQMR